MPNKMLIDASHPEETRVVVVRGNRIEEFDFESQDKKQLKGNIYLARVTRVEPSLQAAFVEYGGNRHGFLAFSEIHPDYYQIPVADRQALLRAEAEEAEDEEDEDNEGDDSKGQDRNRGRRRRRGGKSRGRNGDEQKAEGGDDNAATSSEDGESHASDDEAHDDAADAGQTVAEEHGDDGSEPGSIAASVDADVISEPAPEAASENEDRGTVEEVHSGHHDDHEIESVGAEDAIEEARDRRKPVRRHYKIQEVIKRRQILLVQVVKEERGNKGAALTTYLSLAGRYSVLMPNTARGGGISRKITNAQDRKRLKEVVADLEVPKGMGVILRTAGESRTKAEIKRDYEYLMRMWENVRSLTLQSTAPALVYEEGSLIKRSVRDLYNKEIDEILVAGEDGYREAKDFMRMLMPSHAKSVQPYRDTTPIFARNGIEAQLDKMLQPQVTLKSGGYIIINQTEALVSIDVNSGRSTKEHSIEETALHTNLEAAEEVARQLRLRDLAGLIVIDFIDMEENRNNRAVEKKLKDCLKNDRARIQVGRISHFGLMEMSRQRIRASVLESTMKPCPHCGGTGHVRSDSSIALQVVRAIEEFLLKDSRSHITVKTPIATALYVLNHKRTTLVELEARFGVTITLEADDSVGSQNHAIFRGAIAEKPANFALPVIAPAYEEPEEVEDEIVVEEEEEEEVVEAEAQPARQQQQPQPAPAGEGHDRKRRKRRRRRGGRDRDQAASAEGTDDVVAAEGEAEIVADAVAADDSAEASEAATGEDSGSKKRRRGKRGGKRNRKEDGDELSAADGDDTETSEAIAETVVVESVTVEAVAEEAAAEPVAEAKAKKPRRTAKAKKAAEAEEVVEVPATDAAGEAEPEADAKPAKKAAKPRAPRRKAAAAPAEAPVVTDEAPVVEEAPVAPKKEPAAAKAPAEPVVTSTAEADGDAEGKPKKGGWWQRKSFF